MLAIDPSELILMSPQEMIALRKRLFVGAADDAAAAKRDAEIAKLKKDAAELQRRFEEKRARIKAMTEAMTEVERIAKAEKEMAKVRTAELVAQFKVVSLRNGVVSAREILQEVSRETGYSIGDLLGPRRTAPIVKARHEAIWRIATRRPDMSLPEIARRMGGRDHTTILHAIRSYAERHGLTYPGRRNGVCGIIRTIEAAE